jgi:uncharacterized protein
VNNCGELSESVLALDEMTPLIETLRIAEAECERVSSDNLHYQVLQSARDVQIVFLGTGSAIPSMYRNVSAILLLFGEKSMLMDVVKYNFCMFFSFSEVRGRRF